MLEATPKTWYDIEPIEVITPMGQKIVNRLYCNGYEPTLQLTFKNVEGHEYTIESTLDHAFMTIDGAWLPAEQIEPHHIFDGGYQLSYYEILDSPNMTFDIFVPEENCYILESGIVSHNTALLMGGVSEGINPDPAMTFTQSTAAGEVDRINPTLLTLMKKKGVYTKQNIAQVTEAFGSVQHVEWLDTYEKSVFKTAFEIDQFVVVRRASARGRYVDQWQSLNVFFSAEEPEENIAAVHQAAFTDENVLGLYYIYSKSGIGASKISECVACS